MSKPGGSGPEDRAAASGEDAAPTEVFAAAGASDTDAAGTGGAHPVGDEPPAERRFTAPGFDAGFTEKIETPPPTAEPPTEVFAAVGASPHAHAGAADATAGKQPPQQVAPREAGAKPPRTGRRPWGWIVAVMLVVAALAAVAVLGTLLLTRGGDGELTQEGQVEQSINAFGAAITRGDLAELRTITCGAERTVYERFDDEAWAATHRRVEAAKAYPVIASIDQVIVNGERAEANATVFIAREPDERSTRSFDLQFTDGQWKICQAP